MAPTQMRRAPSIQLGITAFGAIIAGFGVLVIGLSIFIVVLFIRADREHKRHMADLEERGLAIAQTQTETKRNPVTRPRSVLKRNTILPFNSESGWGNLPSVETIRPPSTPPIAAHYAPPKPAGFVPKPKRLSWPFIGRRASGKAIPMKRIRAPVLSTVIESPKPSPFVPVLRGPLGGQPSSPGKGRSRPASDQLLLQDHPAFRNEVQDQYFKNGEARPELLRRSLTAMPGTRTEIYTRPCRSQSMAEIPISNKPGSMTRFPRPKLHARSVSTSSQASGNPPDGGLPILPLEIARIKTEARRHSLLSRSPSRHSVSSYESAGSSILVTQSSPIMRSSNTRVQKVAKRDFRNSMIVGPRPFRDTLTLHGKNKPSQGSIKSSTARFSSAIPTTQPGLPAEKRSSQLTISSSAQSLARMKTADTVTLSTVASPTGSAFAVRTLSTPKRRSGSHVTPYGSPEDRRKRSSILQNALGNEGAPERQLSQASTQASSRRSSNGNPFQWDPAPMSAGKPSALKGSPSARKPGHKRQNCVRISLIPTMLGPRSRSPSPVIHDIQEESPEGNSDQMQNIGLGFSITRSLPRPPSTSVFAPDLKFNATNIRASLTASSPTLSMANFDHGPIGTPVRSQTKPTPPGSWHRDKNRISVGSIFSISAFPSPCHDVPQSNAMVSPPPMFALSPCSNDHIDEARPHDRTTVSSSPFDMIADTNSSRERPLLVDEYDPERPYLVHTGTANLTRSFSSPFSTIPEEPSPKPTLTTDHERHRSDDSAPCSPKTIPSSSCPDLRNRAAYNLPVKDTAIPEEPLDTIDPAILSKDAFSSLNSPFDNRSSITKDSSATRNSIPMPTSTSCAIQLMQPLLDAAFPSSPPIPAIDLPSTNELHNYQAGLEPPGLSAQSSPSSLYSSPSPSPSLLPLPIPPSSPRPAHAQLPIPSIDFAAMPTLTPGGPRGPPPRPLRSSIQTLRRMNSETRRGGAGERRYLHLGREDSITLPGEESWLDELDAATEDEGQTLDEEKGRRLVGDLLNDWDEGATMLELDSAPVTSTVPSTQQDPNPTTKELEKEEPKDIVETSSPRPTSPLPEPSRSSSIWEDGEKFWASTPPRPPVTSPNKPTNRFLQLSSSPVSVRSSRKRAFEVAKDEAPAQEDSHKDGAKREARAKRNSARYRKRSVLGVGTPNVRIQVCPPSDGAEGTPGSLYDSAGFYREG